MKSVALHNLGCKVNAYEMDVMRQFLQESGYKVVPFDEIADIYIINTCTVTNIADRKSRQMLHRAKARNPQAVVVAVGCYVQTGAETVEQDAAIDLAIGNNRKKDLIPILEAFLNEREGGKTLNGSTIIDINHTAEYEDMMLESAAGHTRAYIKIQDGCNQFCSYCVIPYARGRARSRRQEDILAEVRGLVRMGYKEVVLTGIHISSYGIDFAQKSVRGSRADGNAPVERDGMDYLAGGAREEADDRGAAAKSTDEDRGGAGTGTEGVRTASGEGKARGGGLLELVRAIHEVEGLERIRLGSLEPRIVTPEFAAGLKALHKVCPHFHLSLQSGCDAVLKRMNRHYTTGEYYEKVELLRQLYDNPAITTDVITGFPQETEAEFEETRRFLAKTGFYEMHIFKYSRRDGTVAAGMTGQVAEQVKARRSRELLSLGEGVSRAYRERFIGREEAVLLEERCEIAGGVYLVGHTAQYVKAAVALSGAQGRAGRDGKHPGRQQEPEKQIKPAQPGEIVCGRLSGFLQDDILLMEI